jgi:hypothetical protein
MESKRTAPTLSLKFLVLQLHFGQTCVAVFAAVNLYHWWHVQLFRDCLRPFLSADVLECPCFVAAWAFGMDQGFDFYGGRSHDFVLLVFFLHYI